MNFGHRPTRSATSAVDAARKLSTMLAAHPKAAVALHVDDQCHIAVALIEFSCWQDQWMVVDALIQLDPVKAKARTVMRWAALGSTGFVAYALAKHLTGRR